MMSREEIELIIETYKRNKKLFHHNHILKEIYEGNLKEYIDQDLYENMALQAYLNMRDRIAPINILTKIVDKMSTIYNVPPVRKIANGTDQDSELLSWYEDILDINTSMNDGTELFNLSKSHLIQPFAHNGLPRIRQIANDSFFVISTDKIDPLTPTHIITFDADSEDPSKVKFYAYSNDSFAVFNLDGELDLYEMAQSQNEDGINPLLTLPFIYSNQSRFNLLPRPDSDVLTMTKLLPILLSDLNYAVKFQAFSIIYGIDVDDQNLKMAPNTFWHFKSDPTTQTKPEIGTIKPQVDISETLTLIQSQLALWLNSKGIRPGSVGKLEQDSFASGISKIVDEMDTMEYRQKLVDHYSMVERNFWDLIMHTMHPYWVATGQVENRALFSPQASVNIHYTLQLPAQSKQDILAEIKQELDMGLTTVRRALKTIHPLMTDEEIDKLLMEIEEEKKTVVIDNQDPNQLIDTFDQGVDQNASGMDQNQDRTTA